MVASLSVVALPAAGAASQASTSDSEKGSPISSVRCDHWVEGQAGNDVRKRARPYSRIRDDIRSTLAFWSAVLLRRFGSRSTKKSGGDSRAPRLERGNTTPAMLGSRRRFFSRTRLPGESGAAAPHSTTQAPQGTAGKTELRGARSSRVLVLASRQNELLIFGIYGRAIFTESGKKSAKAGRLRQRSNRAERDSLPQQPAGTARRRRANERAPQNSATAPYLHPSFHE